MYSSRHATSRLVSWSAHSAGVEPPSAIDWPIGGSRGSSDSTLQIVPFLQMILALMFGAIFVRHVATWFPKTTQARRSNTNVSTQNVENLTTIGDYDKGRRQSALAEVGGADGALRTTSGA